MKRLLLLLSLLYVSQAFYLPGVAPVNFMDGDVVDLKVNKITSVHTQLPFKYYSLPVCQPPADEIVDKVENLGEILRGDRIENSLYQLRMGMDKDCELLCVKEYGTDDLKTFLEKVGYEYRAHWIVDNLPAAVRKQLQDATTGQITTIYELGFPIGRTTESGEKVLNNHVNIKIYWHENLASYNGKRIVRFEVEPESLAWNAPLDAVACPQGKPIKPQGLTLPKGQDKIRVAWTYSVTWEEDPETEWANRWDNYWLNTDPQIHWFSIINSLMIVLFLTGMVAMIMMRTLHADFRRYNSMDPNEEAEETGWKLVHGDVFRPPTRPMLLSVFVGNGVQLLSMALITMVFALLGFLSPANRGGLLQAMVVLYVVSGVFAGYFAIRNYKMFKGQAWKRTTVMTAFAFPGYAFLVFFILNLFIWGEKSSGAVPFGTLVGIVALWFGISVPLCLFGSYFAFKKPVPEQPVRTNQIPRQVPDQVWYMSPIFSILMGGVLPFGAVFIELFFILSAIWGNQLYYIFGFLFIVFVILILTCAEITIVMCYFQLCSEDYHWWWRSFLTAGASAFYMFLYSIFYFFTRMEIEKFVSGLMYFGYSSIMALGFFFLTGTIGYYACYFFVRKIYGSVKVD